MSAALSDYPKLSDDAQRALAAFQILQFIRQMHPNQRTINKTYNHAFQCELINQKIVNPAVVSKENISMVMDIFTLKHSLDPSIPLLNFTTGDKQLNQNKSYSYHPTQTTKTLFNIFLNSERQPLISGGYGLAKNIAVYLLWHLSAFITNFRMQEEIRILQPYVNFEQLKRIPKFFYYQLEEESEAKAIGKLEMQCSDIDQNPQTLQDFCALVAQSYNEKGIRVSYIIVSSELQPDFLLNQIQKSFRPQWINIQIDEKLQDKLLLFNNIRAFFKNQKKTYMTPDLILRQIRWNTYCNKKFETIYPTQLQEMETFVSMESVHSFNCRKKSIDNSNRLINYQKTYFLIFQRIFFYYKCSFSEEKLWPIDEVRKIYKSLSIMMHDDYYFFSIYEDEIELLKTLISARTNSFTLFECQFLNRTIYESVQKQEKHIILNSKEWSDFGFKTRCAYTNQVFILDHLRKYISLSILNKEQFVRAFYSIMARLMSHYSQQFSLHINEAIFRIKAEYNSKFQPIIETQNIFHLDTHIKNLKYRVSNLKNPSYYLSAISSSWHTTAQNQCLDCILLKWNKQTNQYDLKSIEWAFQIKMEDYWQGNNIPIQSLYEDENYGWPFDPPMRKLTRIERAIRAHKQAELSAEFRREHFIICPQLILDELRGISGIFECLEDGVNKWKVTLAAIEDVRFSDFTYHDENLICSVNQLLECLTISRVNPK